MDLSHEGKAILKLKCSTCDNLLCEVGPKYVSSNSSAGCLRWVPEEVFDKYIHYMYEVMPFWYLYKAEQVNQSYNEISDFLANLYKNYPIEKILDEKGKVIGDSYANY